MPIEEPLVELPAEPSLPPDVHRRRGMFFIGLAVGAVSFTMAIQLGVNANYLVEQIGIDPQQLGFLEAVRETCGITAFGILAVFSGVAEPLVGAAMLVLLAAGLGAYAFVPDYAWVVLMSLVWSQGLHVWMPLPNSMTLSLAEEGRAGHRLGQVQAAGAAGSLLGLGVSLLLTYLGVPIRPLWILAGVAGVAGAAACLGVPRQIKTHKQPLRFRRKYGLYYLLCFLEGWRKQIFLCFAGYLLVRVHGASLTQILLLWAIAQPVSYVLSPRVGKIIDKFGERPVLVFYYASMAMLFVGYAFIPNKYVLFTLFTMDSVFFTLAMALTTYVNRLAPKSEHTQTLSAGVAMNHIAAVSMPLIGGILWAKLDRHWPFLIGTLAAALSIVAALRLPRRNAQPIHPQADHA